MPDRHIRTAVLVWLQSSDAVSSKKASNDPSSRCGESIEKDQATCVFIVWALHRAVAAQFEVHPCVTA